MFDARPRYARLLTSTRSLAMLCVLWAVLLRFVGSGSVAPVYSVLVTLGALLCLALSAAVLIAGLRHGFSPRCPPGACRVCGYDLTGNTSGICPECGADLDLAPTRPPSDPRA